MLVLTRRPNEAIVIDGRIKVTVVSLKNGQVRLGIEAPSDVHILREELVGNSPVTATRGAGVGASVSGTPPRDPARVG